jgi:hypothetical protein
MLYLRGPFLNSHYFQRGNFLVQTLNLTQMKNLLALSALGLFLLVSSPVKAQDASGSNPPTNKTQQVIASIPSLQSISLEIASFEQKRENQKAELNNADADLRALKIKYAAELEVQISVNKDNAETVQILTEELKKTRAEIELLNGK